MKSPPQTWKFGANGSIKSERVGVATTVCGTTLISISSQSDGPSHPTERTRMVDVPLKLGSQFMVPLLVICLVAGATSLKAWAVPVGETTTLNGILASVDSRIISSLTLL